MWIGATQGSAKACDGVDALQRRSVDSVTASSSDERVHLPPTGDTNVAEIRKTARSKIIGRLTLCETKNAPPRTSFVTPAGNGLARAVRAFRPSPHTKGSQGL